MADAQLNDGPGSNQEKFEIMKSRLVAKGQWNSQQEASLRQSLGLNVVVKSRVTKSRVKKSKKKGV